MAEQAKKKSTTVGQKKPNSPPSIRKTRIQREVIRKKVAANSPAIKSDTVPCCLISANDQERPGIWCT